jgi:PAS domain S-box-containing protein
LSLQVKKIRATQGSTVKWSGRTRNKPATPSAFELLLVDISTRFIALPADRVDSEILLSQQKVCECLRLDVSVLWQRHPDRPGSLISTHFFATPDFPVRPPEDMDAMEMFPWSLKTVFEGKTIRMPRLADYPAAAVTDVEWFRYFNIKSNITLPLSTGDGPVFGALAFSVFRKERAWSTEIVDKLRLVAQIFAGALARIQADRALRESEERWRLAAGAAELGGYSYDFRTGQMFRSPEHMALYGLPADTTLKLDENLMPEALYAEDKAGLLAQMMACADPRGSGILDFEHRILRADGQIRWLRVQGRTTFSDDGRPLRSDGIVQDITERKRMETALNQSEESYRAMFDNANDALFVHDPASGKIIDVNQKMCELYSFTREEALNIDIKSLSEGHPPYSQTEAIEKVRKACESGSQSFEWMARNKSGRLFWADVNLKRVTIGGEERIMAVVRDVTERKQTEGKLSYILKAIESTREAIGISDSRGRHFYQNKALSDLFEYATSEELQAAGGGPAVVKDPKVSKEMYNNIMHGKPWAGELEMVTKSGRVFPAFERADSIRDHEGNIIGLIGIITDITERKRTEEALQKSEERFRQVAEIVSDFIWEIDTDGLYTYTSPSVEKILGYTPDELVGKMHFYDLFAPDARELLKKAALEALSRQQPFHAFANNNVAKSGRIVRLETSGMPVLDDAGRLLGYRGADTDVTERYLAERETQLLREELALFSRVATVNELTASIAHELNQPLAAILSNAQSALRFMRRDNPNMKELQEILEDIVSDDQRAAEVIRSMRSMLKRGSGERRSLLLNDLINDVLSIVRNDGLIRGISIIPDLGSPMPPVAGDRVQLQQVILNLIINAFEAMEGSEGSRELKLRTRHAGNEIILDVMDSGFGISPDKLDKIFEPFFSTKQTGLGIGLALSRSIVASHNGRLWTENNSECGATFHMALPAADLNSPHA